MSTETTAETLREAAALMRERADAVDTSATKWECAEGEQLTWADGIRVLMREPDADYHASWHPAVAFAVADWLEDHAQAADTLPTDPDPRAVAVAVAYLGHE